MVNGKMCVSVSNDNLECRFAPFYRKKSQKKMALLCYVSPDRYKAKMTFNIGLSYFWP